MPGPDITKLRAELNAAVAALIERIEKLEKRVGTKKKAKK